MCLLKIIIGGSLCRLTEFWLVIHDLWPAEMTYSDWLSLKRQKGPIPNFSQFETNLVALSLFKIWGYSYLIYFEKVKIRVINFCAYLWGDWKFALRTFVHYFERKFRVESFFLELGRKFLKILFWYFSYIFEFIRIFYEK